MAADLLFIDGLICEHVARRFLNQNRRRAAEVGVSEAGVEARVVQRLERLQRPRVTLAALVRVRS